MHPTSSVISAKSRINVRSLQIALVVSALILLSPFTVFAGNDFVYMGWGTPYSDVWGSGGYYTNIYPANVVTNDPAYNAFTTGWFGMTLAPPVCVDSQGNPAPCNGSNELTYSEVFTQAGTQSKNGYLRWFVYSEAAVTCDRGMQTGPDPDGINRGCLGVSFGSSGDHVALNTYSQVMLHRDFTTSTGWIASVYDGQTFVDLAHISGYTYTIAPGGRIYYNAYNGQVYGPQVSTEEGYDPINDPFELMYYFFYHVYY